MPTNTPTLSFQLLQFAVPGMPQVALALPLVQVLAVGDLPPSIPLPFTPFFVRGVSEWRDQIITVIDLAVLLRDQPAAPNTLLPEAGTDRFQFVIAQVAVKGRRPELIAWPILPGAKTVVVPAVLEQAAPVENILSWLTFSTVMVDQPLTILDLDQVVTGFSPG